MIRVHLFTLWVSPFASDGPDIVADIDHITAGRKPLREAAIVKVEQSVDGHVSLTIH